jgi:Zn-finger nucleic acid-binding protein
MNCPVDNELLQMSERSGVEVDYCPRCRGVWLDRGELDKIIERAEREFRPIGRDDDDDDDRYRDDRPRYDEDRPRYDEDRREGYRMPERPYKKRKKNFLSEMLEFGD